MKIVKGVALDPQTRCAHYHSPLDIIAIKMACCQTYYACKDCHAELADHPLQAWPPTKWDMPAILCGACKQELTIRHYLQSGSSCPNCNADFNPGCAKHHHFYFAA
ncbi:MAG: CHY zinc finger protein [Pseudomonadota bacterium]|nr:CHY zinc finger protein [Pseudomonadota bacterium]